VSVPDPIPRRKDTSDDGTSAASPDGSPGEALPQGEAKRAAVRAMFDRIAPRYDLMNRLMTFGLDTWWRRRTLDWLGTSPGSLVVDIGCGTGDLTRGLRRRGRRVVGVDFSSAMLRSARGAGAPMVQADAAALPFRSRSADAAVSAFTVRNFSDLRAVLGEAARVVRDGGRLALLEVGEPEGRLVGLGHRIWFQGAVPRLGALLSDGAAYRYLPRSVEYLPSAEELASLLGEAGFAHLRFRRLSGGVAQCVTATRRGERSRRP
jgi:demethylmenaquinone methyltransferase / 2-methoxy-6-polyprenyl-1,4-benzoquinol methylase